MNPVEEFLGASSEKTAGVWGDLGRQSGNALVAGVVTGIGTAALAGGAIAAQHIYDAATAKRDFRGMMEWNQDLQHAEKRDVVQSFKTLRRFAPDMSRDPLVAGTFVRRMVETPQGVAGFIQEALQGQKSVGSPIQNAVISAASGAMSSGSNTLTPFGKGPEFVRKDVHEKELAKTQRDSERSMQDLFYKHHDDMMAEADRHGEALAKKDRDIEAARQTIRMQLALGKGKDPIVKRWMGKRS